MELLFPFLNCKLFANPDDGAQIFVEEIIYSPTVADLGSISYHEGQLSKISIPYKESHLHINLLPWKFGGER